MTDGRPTLDEYRRERAAKLERQVEHLDAERKRLERLLAGALRVAVGQSGVSPTELLQVIAELEGIDLNRPAWVVERERVEAVNCIRQITEAVIARHGVAA